MATRRLLLLSQIPRPPTTSSALSRISITPTTRHLTLQHHRQPPRPRHAAIVPPQTHTHTRSQTTTAEPSRPKLYDFAAVQTLSESPSATRVLIDVREPAEYADGYIPSAINLPLKSAPEALLLPADEFADRFGFAKPAAEQEVVFYCRSGVRSSAAARLAEQAGYGKVAEYKGSWLDWAAQGGKVGR